MEVIFSLTLGIVASAGVYLVLQARTFSIVLGLTLLSYATNLFLFSAGRLEGDAAVYGTSENLADPLPQALVLTAIVISFAMTSFVVVLALRSVGESGSDHIDGLPDEKKRAK